MNNTSDNIKLIEEDMIKFDETSEISALDPMLFALKTQTISF